MLDGREKEGASVQDEDGMERSGAKPEEGRVGKGGEEGGRVVDQARGGGKRKEMKRMNGWMDGWMNVTVWA